MINFNRKFEPDIYNSKHFLDFVDKETKVKSHTDPMTPLLVVVNYFFINDSEEYEECPVCQSSTPTSKIILCDRCDKEMCFSCAEIEKLPTGKWYCSSSCEEQTSKCSFCKLKGHNIRTCPVKLKNIKKKVKLPPKLSGFIPKGLEIKSKGWANNFKDLNRNTRRIRKQSKKSLESFSGSTYLKSPKITNILNLSKGQKLWGNWKRSFDENGYKLWWPCKVIKIKPNNCYDLIYEDGEIEVDVKYNYIRKTRPVS